MQMGTESGQKRMLGPPEVDSEGRYLRMILMVPLYGRSIPLNALAATIRSATPAGSNLEGDGAEADRSGFSGGEDR